MTLSENDIKEFGKLRKHLAPFLTKKQSEVLQKIESRLSAGTKAGITLRKKKFNHKELVKTYL